MSDADPEADVDDAPAAEVADDTEAADAPDGREPKPEAVVPENLRREFDPGR
jgi:hypothetical protein